MTSEAVLYNITGNRNLSNTHVDEIAAIVKEYPYFSPAQFLLALKQKRDSSFNYQYQLQKTSLYFSNQAWLNYLITEKEVSVPDLKLVEPEPIEKQKETEEENIFPTSLLGSNNLFQPIDLDELNEHLNVPLKVSKEGQTKNENGESVFDYNSLFSNKENTIEVPTLDVVKQLFDGKSKASATEELPLGHDLVTDYSFEGDLPTFPNILEEPIAVELPKHNLPTFSFGNKEEEKMFEKPSFSEMEFVPIHQNAEYEVNPFKEEVIEKIQETSETDKSVISKESSSVYVSMPSREEPKIELENKEIHHPTSNFNLEGIDAESLISHLDLNKYHSEPITEVELEGDLHSIHEATPTVEVLPPIIEKIKEVEQESLIASTSIIPTYTFKGFSDSVSNQETTHSLSDAVSISEAYSNKNIEEEADNTEYVNNISSIISNQVEDFKKPIEENAKLEFENEHHHHTIDYFASQGIKIDLTKVKQDKLTLQMRRFTDWLKQIKKQDPNPQDLGTDPELEKAIMNIAKTSLEAREIVTETMADVFIKQGKVNKAIQLYIKLSFLDPQKSTYFATKIQQLKGI